jgi:hypothetical protein
MKRGSRKLALERETLVALTGDALSDVAGGAQSVQSITYCPPSQKTFCPTQLFCPSLMNSQPQASASASQGGK